MDFNLKIKFEKLSGDFFKHLLVLCFFIARVILFMETG